MSALLKFGLTNRSFPRKRSTFSRSMARVTPAARSVVFTKATRAVVDGIWSSSNARSREGAKTAAPNVVDASLRNRLRSMSVYPPASSYIGHPKEPAMQGVVDERLGLV